MILDSEARTYLAKQLNKVVARAYRKPLRPFTSIYVRPAKKIVSRKRLKQPRKHQHGKTQSSTTSSTSRQRLRWARKIVPNS